MTAAGAERRYDAAGYGIRARIRFYPSLIIVKIAPWPPAGVMHEGRWSLILGLKGMPATAEEIDAIRDCALAKFNRRQSSPGPCLYPGRAGWCAARQVDGVAGDM